MESPFDILSVSRDAGEEEIEQAYRERLKDAHPDHGGSVSEFQMVRAAYEELTSESQRRTQGIRYEASVERERETPSRVEYLNYEVLSDHGWRLDDENLFEKAADSELDAADYGRFLVQPEESLLEAAENRGFRWPYACRGGACANCAVAVVEGELSMPINHVLPEEMTERGIRLSCVGAPTTDEMKVVYNVKHLPDLDELRLPPGPFEQAMSDD